MSQAILQIPSAPSGLDMRVQLNAIVLALLSQSAGPSAPSPTYGGMFWGDTTAGRLRRRSNDNTAWLDLGPLDDFLGDLRTGITSAATAASNAQSTANSAVSAAATAQSTANSAASAAAAAQSTANSKLDSNAAAIVGALGYTPVKTGSANAIAIAWNNDLSLTVDNTNLGTLWTNYQTAGGLGANDYLKLPNGRIFQWGLGQVSSSTTVNFPVAFPNYCLSVVATPNGASNQSITCISWFDRFGFGWTPGNSASAAQWFAIGY